MQRTITISGMTYVVTNSHQISLAQDIYNEWKRCIGQQSTGAEIENCVIKVASVELFNQKYVATKMLNGTTAGNSNIEVMHAGKSVYGRITLLFRVEASDEMWFVVCPFGKMSNWDKSKSPYKKLPNIHIQMFYQEKYDKTIVVPLKAVIGHIAVLANPEGTFGIAKKTVSVVGLGNIVSDD